MKSRHAKPAMREKTRPHPGLERDAKGHPIPMEKRLPENRESAHRAAAKKKTTKTTKR
jgi:hypothetical protein